MRIDKDRERERERERRREVKKPIPDHKDVDSPNTIKHQFYDTSFTS